jgi:hypothetical protein
LVQDGATFEDIANSKAPVLTMVSVFQELNNDLTQQHMTAINERAALSSRGEVHSVGSHTVHALPPHGVHSSH